MSPKWVTTAVRSSAPAARRASQRTHGIPSTVDRPEAKPSGGGCRNVANGRRLGGGPSLAEDLVLTLRPGSGRTVVTAYRVGSLRTAWRVTVDDAVRNVAGCGPVL